MRKRLRSHEGANAVEFALVLPPLLILIFGAITAGLALNAKQQLDHAAREGVRYAATLTVGSPACEGPDRPWHECVRDHTLGASVGTITLGPGQGGICVSHIADDGSVSTELYGDIATDSGVASDPCFTETPSLNGARVQVKAETPARVDAVFVRTGIFDLVSKSVAKYEE